MADDAFIHFDTDVEAVVARIRSALENLSRGSEGMSLAANLFPPNAFDQFTREYNRALEQAEAELRRVFSAQNIAGIRERGGTFSAQTQMQGIVTRAFDQAALQIDRTLAQMGPQQRLEMVRSGALHKMYAEVGDSVFSELQDLFIDVRRQIATGPERVRGLARNIDYEPIRAGIDRLIRRNVTAVGEDLAKVYRTRELATGVMARDVSTSMLTGAGGRIPGTGVPIFEKDPTTGLAIPTSAKAERDAEQRAFLAREREFGRQAAEAIRESKEQIRRAQIELAEEIATGPMSDRARLFRALGVFEHPDMPGVPAKRTALGVAEVVHPTDLVEYLRRLDTLERELEQTRRLITGGEGTRIQGTTTYRTGAPGEERFFRPVTIGTGLDAMRVLREIDPAQNLVDWATAMQAWEREQANNREAARQALERIARDQQRVMDQRVRDEEKARRDAERAAARTPGFLGGLQQGVFAGGFSIAGEPVDLTREQLTTTLGRTLGSALRYSAAYGGLYALTQAASQALQEFSDFQDSLTDYEVAIRDADGATFATTGTMMELSRVVGDNVGAAYDAAARGVRAFAEAQDSANQKAEVGLSVATASQQLAVITGKDIVDATGDVVSIGTSFGLSAAQAETIIPDAIANAKKLGGDPEQIAQGLSNFAVTAEEAGWNIQQAANIISLVQARTDQSGQAVATRLSRIVSILGGTTGKGLANTINTAFREDLVDVGADPAKQIEQIARAYVRAGREGRDSLQGLIRSQLGGTSNVRELIPLLEEQERLQRALAQSLPGAGATEYERKVAKFYNQIQQIAGSFKNLVVIAAEADIAAPFAALVGTVEPALHLLERFLRVYTSIHDFQFTLGGLLPEARPLGAVTTTVGEAAVGYYAVRKLMQTALAQEIAGTTGVVGAVTRAAGVAAPAVDIAATTSTTAHTTAVNADTVATERHAAAQTSAMAGFGRFMAVIGKIALVAGAIVTVEQLIEDREKVAAAQASRSRILASIGSTGEELAYSENALRAQARNATKGIPWWSNVASFFVNNLGQTSREQAQAQGAATRATADAVGAIKNSVQAEESRVEALRDVGIFGDQATRTTESLAAAFEQLSAAGVPPEGLFRRFAKAWLEPPLPAVTSAEAPRGLAAQITSATLTSLRRELPQEPRWRNLSNFFTTGERDMPTRVAGGELFNNLNLRADEIRELNQSAVDNIRRAARDGKITEGELNNALSDAIGTLDLSDLEAYSINVARLKREVAENARKSITIINDAGSTAMPPPSAAELNQMIEAMDANLQAAFPDTLFGQLRRAQENWRAMRARWEATDWSGGRRNQRDQWGDVGAAIGAVGAAFTLNPALMGAGRRAGGSAGAEWFGFRHQQFTRELRLREHAARELLVQRATMLREAEEAAYDPTLRRNWAILQRIRMRGARRQVRAADNDPALLKQVFDTLDRETVKAIISSTRVHMEAQRTAYESARHAVQAAFAGVQAAAEATAALPFGQLFGALAQLQDMLPKSLDDQWKHTRGVLRSMRRAFRFSTPELLSPWRQAEEDAEKQKKEKDAQRERDRLTAAQRAAVHEAARIPPDDTVAQARNAIAAARADMQAAKFHSREWWDALSRLNQGKYDLAQAEAARASSAQQAEAARVGGDIAAAKAAIDGAARQMRAATRGTDAYNQALASYYDGQRQLRDAIAAHQFVLDQLAGDMTDPVEQARDALRDVRRRLSMAIRAGQAPDVIDALRLEEEQAQHARERAAFDQRMSDAQIANELGRMSFQAYMNYLDREHDRLTAIKHRTRQQQDMLNEVDQAIKAAMDSMDEQFNLGDIDTAGLVYQTRRFLAEQRHRRNDVPMPENAGPRWHDIPHPQPLQMQQDVRIHIDGADVGEVRRVLNDILGPRATQTRAVLHRKVG